MIGRHVYTPKGYNFIPTMEKGYHSVEVSRGDRRFYSTTSGDYHTKYDYLEMVNESRAFDRDNSLYSSLLDRFTGSILGSEGFKLQVRTKDEELNKTIEDKFKNWSKNPDIRGLRDWVDIQFAVARDIAVAGDILLVKIRGRNQLQLIESEQITYDKEKVYYTLDKDGNYVFSREVDYVGESRELTVVQGVALDEYGAPVAYHIEDWGATDGLPKTNSGRWINKRDCILVSNNPSRVSMTRGIPVLQQSFANLHRLNDILSAEAIAWQLMARFAVAINKDNAAVEAYGTSTVDSSKDSNYTDDDLSTRIHDVDYATIFHGEKGETISGIDQNRPSQNFGESTRVMLRLITMPLGIPMEILMLDWTDTNYSSARASLMQAYQIFKQWQRKLIRQLHIPVFKWILGVWQNNGSISLPKGISFNDVVDSISWQSPPFPWVDPEKETKSWAIMVEHNFASHSDALMMQGKDRQEMNEERKREVLEAISISKEIEAQTGEKVPWQPFAGGFIEIKQEIESTGEKQEVENEQRKTPVAT